jgi:hypothetical protein
MTRLMVTIGWSDLAGSGCGAGGRGGGGPYAGLPPYIPPADGGLAYRRGPP